MNNDLLERLRELEAAATKGPWELQDGCSWRRIGTPGRDGSVLCPDTYSREDRHPDLTAGSGEDLYANLRLIVAMRNALPDLLSAFEQQERRYEFMVSSLLDAVASHGAKKGLRGTPAAILESMIGTVSMVLDYAENHPEFAALKGDRR